MAAVEATTASAAPALIERSGDRVNWAQSPPNFSDLYEQYFDFVWRSLRRLGVPLALVDDATQDVFVVVHRRLNDFEGRSSPKTWLFAIALHVAQHHRRTLARHPNEEFDEGIADFASVEREDRQASLDAARLVYELLDTLDDDKRAVFVLAHLEQMPAPEIALALGIPTNTVYSRLRIARRNFDLALRRHVARGQR